MRKLIAFLLGIILFNVLIQLFIIYTREPFHVQCDGGGQA
jgi:hypothetical protein